MEVKRRLNILELSGFSDCLSGDGPVSDSSADPPAGLETRSPAGDLHYASGLMQINCQTLALKKRRGGRRCFEVSGGPPAGVRLVLPQGELPSAIIIEN